MANKNVSTIYYIIIAQIIAIVPTVIILQSEVNLNDVALVFYILYFISGIAILAICRLLKDGFKFAKPVLTLICAAFFTLSTIEAANIYVTTTPFSFAFWNLASVDFFLSSLITYKYASLLGLAGLIFIAALTYKFLQTPSKQVDYKKSSLIIALALIVLFAYSPLGRAIKSYCQYKVIIADAKADKILSEEKITNTNSKPKNIIHIYLESFNQDFTDNNKHPNLTPNLSRIKNDGIELTNLKQIKYAKYSEAGHYIANKGQYHLLNKEPETSLSKKLKEASYYNVFIRGASKSSGGAVFKDIYSKENGFDEYIASETLKNEVKNSKPATWGYNDDVLFNYTINKLDKLAESNNPFYLALFTLDAHEGQELSKTCDNLKYENSNPLIKAINCTDYLLADFLNTIKSKQYYKDTLIIIHADHVSFKIDDTNNNIFGLILNSDKKAFKQSKETFLFDIPSTILENANVNTSYHFLQGEDISIENFHRMQKLEPKFNNSEDIDKSVGGIYRIIADL